MMMTFVTSDNKQFMHVTVSSFVFRDRFSQMPYPTMLSTAY